MTPNIFTPGSLIIDNGGFVLPDINAPSTPIVVDVDIPTLSGGSALIIDDESDIFFTLTDEDDTVSNQSQSVSSLVLTTDDFVARNDASQIIRNSSAGFVQMDGGRGNDSLYATFSEVTRLKGGSGNDELYGGVGNDTLSGGWGADFINPGQGDDIINVDRGGAPDVIDLFEGGADTVNIFGDDGQLKNITIQGFTPGEDILNISDTSLESKAPLVAVEGDNVILRYYTPGLNDFNTTRWGTKAPSLFITFEGGSSDGFVTEDFVVEL